MCIVALAPAASAQPGGLIAKLKAGVKCSEPVAAKSLLRNVNGSGAARNDILMALDEISIDAKVCIQIKDAASALALDLSKGAPKAATNAPGVTATVDVAVPADISDDVVAEPAVDFAADVAAADLRVQQILAEADQRAASMRFEVGPPPPKMTRNRQAPR